MNKRLMSFSSNSRFENHAYATEIAGAVRMILGRRLEDYQLKYDEWLEQEELARISFMLAIDALEDAEVEFDGEVWILTADWPLEMAEWVSSNIDIWSDSADFSQLDIPEVMSNSDRKLARLQSAVDSYFNLAKDVRYAWIDYQQARREYVKVVSRLSRARSRMEKAKISLRAYQGLSLR